MGFDISAVLMVGLPWDSLPFDIQMCYEEDGEYPELDIVAPYFDSNFKDCLFGKIIERSEDYNALTIHMDKVMADIVIAQDRLVGILGDDLRILLVPNIL